MKTPLPILNPRRKNAPLRFILPLLWLALSLSGCGGKTEPSLPEIDYNKAKAISDAAAQDFIKRDIKGLYQKLDVGFHLVVKGPDDLRAVMEKMYGLYGRPLKCDFKAAQAGMRTDDTLKRPTRTFLYAIKTTKYPEGKYFLKIEVVSAFNGGFLDVSGFGFFTFKEGATVPNYLK
jgi:hypothetical protein